MILNSRSFHFHCGKLFNTIPEPTGKGSTKLINEPKKKEDENSRVAFDVDPQNGVCLFKFQILIIRWKNNRERRNLAKQTIATFDRSYKLNRF